MLKCGVPVIIRLLICDVDGTLTDGSVYYGDNNIEIKAFNVKDGLILKLLNRFGIDVIFLTGRESEAVRRRAADFGATAIQGINDKAAILNDLFDEYKIKANQCAYIGDDLNDYAAMRLCGFKACPADAAIEIRDICDYVSPCNGGHGAVRDICENLLKCENKYGDFLTFYGMN